LHGENIWKLWTYTHPLVASGSHLRAGAVLKMDVHAPIQVAKKKKKKHSETPTDEILWPCHQAFTSCPRLTHSKFRAVFQVPAFRTYKLDFSRTSPMSK
jgi:hypothetical protein